MLKQITKITFVIIGALIGAGFASGQEIYLFFFSYGIKGILGIIISSILFGIVIYKVFNIILQNDIQSYKQFLEIIIGTTGKFKEYIIQLINIVINLFILITFFIMIAAFGTYLSENIQIPKAIGSSILAVLCIIILSKEVKGIVKVSEWIVPILTVFILIIGIISFKDIDFRNLQYYIVPKHSNWIISSILYTSYNMILLIPVLISLNKIIDSRQISKIALLVSIIIIVLAICIYSVMIKIDVDIQFLEMPISYAITTRFSYLKIIYGIVILSSILTTAISLGTGFLQNIEKNKLTRMKLFIFICIISIPISSIGFSKLIQFMYPIFGVLGLIQILKIITIKTVEKTKNI